MSQYSPFDPLNPNINNRLKYDKGRCVDGDVLLYEGDTDEAITGTVNLSNIVSFATPPTGPDGQLITWNTSTSKAVTSTIDLSKTVQFSAIPTGPDNQAMVYNPSSSTASTISKDLSKVVTFYSTYPTGNDGQLITWNPSSNTAGVATSLVQKLIVQFDQVYHGTTTRFLTFNLGTQDAGISAYETTHWPPFVTLPTGIDGQVVVFNPSTGTFSTSDADLDNIVQFLTPHTGGGDGQLVLWNPSVQAADTATTSELNLCQFTSFPTTGGDGQVVVFNPSNNKVATSNTFIHFSEVPSSTLPDGQFVRYNPSTGEAYIDPTDPDTNPLIVKFQSVPTGTDNQLMYFNPSTQIAYISPNIVGNLRNFAAFWYDVQAAPGPPTAIQYPECFSLNDNAWYCFYNKIQNNSSSITVFKGCYGYISNINDMPFGFYIGQNGFYRVEGQVTLNDSTNTPGTSCIIVRVP